MSDVTDIPRNIRDIIGKAVIDGAVDLPQSTLTASVTAGTATIAFTPDLDGNGHSKIREGSRGFFYDGTTERVFTLSSVDAGNASGTIETSSLIGFHGFQTDHAAGTPIIWHLYDNAGFDPSAMTRGGQAAVFITLYARADDGELQPDGGYPSYQVHIQTNMQYTTPDTSVNAADWQAHCEHTSNERLVAIAEALLADQTLATDFSPDVAERFGRTGNNRVMDFTFGPTPMDKNGAVWAYIGVLQFIVTGAGRLY